MSEEDPQGAAAGGTGGFDFASLLESAQSMQKQILDAQAQLAETEVEGSAGGGVVKVQMTGDGRFIGVTIDPGVVDPEDVAMLEDLVLAALHDASAKAAELAGSAGGLDLGSLGDMGLGGMGLGGMLGGAG